MKKDSVYCGCLFFSAGALSRNLTRIAEEEYRPTGLSPSHALLLLTISGYSGVRPSQLAEEMQLTPSTVTRLLDKLESKKMITRAGAGKSVIVKATTRGLALVPTIKEAWLRLYHRYSKATGKNREKLTRWVYDTAQKLT